MSINNSEAFANQVQILLKRTSDLVKGLSKKDAVRMLEFVLKFPYEHEDVMKKLSKPEHKAILDHIIEVTTAKNNLVVTFLAENGHHLQELRNQEKVDGNVLDQGLDEEKCDCGVPCVDCDCQGEEK